MGAREDILARIRAATVPPVGRVMAPPQPGPGDVNVLVDRLSDYRAGVRLCGEPDLAGVIAEVLAERTTLVIPPDVPKTWLSGYPGRVLVDGKRRPLTVAELDEPGVGVLTGCAVAIAETGTVVLDAGPGQARRLLTLVPDHHVCVVWQGQIMDRVPDALAALGDARRPLTFISGPSATSDIELDRVEGVHGPRRLDVIVVRNSFTR